MAALVGRPNVGKSTLFNRLASAVRGRQTDALEATPLKFVRSVVHSLPGVTRDPREATGAISDLLFNIVDTPGLEGEVNPLAPTIPNVEPPPNEEKSLISAIAHCPDVVYRRIYASMQAAAIRAVKQADVIFFIIDVSTGVTELDRAHAKWLRTSLTPEKHLILIANKCDVAQATTNAIDAYSLGFGHPVLLSAEHGLGFADLYEQIRSIRKLLPPKKLETTPAQAEQFDQGETILRQSFDDELVLTASSRLRELPLPQVITSIVGRPNVGKSTLLNKLIGENRSIVGAAPGITRDALLCQWNIQHKRTDFPPVWLVDTPGVRAEAKVSSEDLERLAVKASLQALRQSHVIICVLDASEPLTQQDVKILDVVVTEGRAVVLVVNKMDKLDIPKMSDWRVQLRYKIDSKLEQLQGVELVEMSAINWEADPKQGLRLYEAVQRARERWEKRVPTSALNRFVKGFNERMSVGGGTRGEKRNRIGVTKFITQKKIRPPMFRLDGSSAVSMNYLRALSNAIRNEFGFLGVPIRVKRPSRRRRL